MAKGHVVTEDDQASGRKMTLAALPLGTALSGGAAPVQPDDGTSSYGAVGQKEVLAPHMTGAMSHSQKRVRRVAILLAGMVILIKAMMLLSSAGSAGRKHKQPAATLPPPVVWHAGATRATPNHIRPGFVRPITSRTPPLPGDVTFH